jgi:hypothetical protein
MKRNACILLYIFNVSGAKDKAVLAAGVIRYMFCVPEEEEEIKFMKGSLFV